MWREVRSIALIAIVVPLAACSGGGGSPSAAVPQPESLATSAPSPSAGDLQSTIVGTVVDLPYDGTSANPGYSVVPPNGSAPRAGSPIAGAQVFVGPQVVLGSTPPPNAPAGFAVGVTDATGTFRITNGPTGAVAVSIFAPAPHVAALHADLALAGGANAVGPYFLTVPTAAEMSWFAQENADRTPFGVAPLGLDEAALEASRYWASFMQRNQYFAHCIPASSCEAGSTATPPPAYGPQDVDPSHRFHYEHGFSGAQDGENIAAGFPSWQGVEQAFMAERTACPNGQPANCPFTDATGHFLNIVDAEYAWAAVAIVSPASGAPYYDQEFSDVLSATPTTASSVVRQNFASGLRR
jgi:uncharacterized protein YkwD